MFTGIVEEKGKISKIDLLDGRKRLAVFAPEICKTLKIGDSISINGACQTAIEINQNIFAVDTVNETLKKTTLNFLKIGDFVNLEPAILPTSRMGGHFVQGHIDAIGQILQINQLNNSAEIYCSFPQNFRKYLAKTGSIAIDGVALTTAEIFDANFKVAVIPHTFNSSIISHYKVGQQVNLEFDIIGKYVESILLYSTTNTLEQKNSCLNIFLNQPDI